MKPVEALQAVAKQATALQSNVAQVPEGLSEGVSLLQAKSATLLRYNLNLLRLSLAKVRGEEIKEYAEILSQDWAALEKLRPLERKVRYQIDALLRPAVAEAERHRPDASAMGAWSDEEEEEGVYRPPRISKVVFEGREERERQVRDKVLKRRVRNEGVREMLDEVRGRPEVVGGRDGRTERLVREEEGRRRYEEEFMTRLNVSRKDRKRRREIERGEEGGDELEELKVVAEKAVAGGGGEGAKTGGSGSGKKKKRRR